MFNLNVPISLDLKIGIIYLGSDCTTLITWMLCAVRLGSPTLKLCLDHKVVLRSYDSTSSRSGGEYIEDMGLEVALGKCVHQLAKSESSMTHTIWP